MYGMLAETAGMMQSSTAPNNSATEAAEANAQPDFREPDGNEPMTQQPLYQPRQRKQGLATAAAGAALVRASGPLALVSDLADDADGLDMDVDQVRCQLTWTEPHVSLGTV